MSTMFTGPGAFESVVYQDYVPQWTCASGGNPSLGNGTSIGRWARSSKFVHYYGEVDFGSSTTYGGGQWLISTPVLAKTQAWLLSPVLYESPTSKTILLNTYINGSDPYFRMSTPTTFGGTDVAVSATSPFSAGDAPAAGGFLAWNVVFEAA